MTRERTIDLSNFKNYTKAKELWVVTVYYNPCRFKSRRETYDAFMETMRASGINVMTVECAFGDEPFELPVGQNIIRVRSNTLLWQKERLINIGVNYLPKTCKYVAWIDCDVVFENKDWALQTCELLSDSCTVVQLFDTAIKTEYGNVLKEGCEQVTSFSLITGQDISTLDCGRYDKHGHTGYAWAMRREIFTRVGLYEHAITGSADHFMAHAIYDRYGFCIENGLKRDQRQFNHLKRWGKAFYELAQGKLGTVTGTLLHLWHGTTERRNYFSRMWKVTEFGYNPDIDLIAIPGRALEWREHALKNKPELVAFFAEYFESRKEDDAA